MTITANYFMTIFGVVLAIGFSYRLLVPKPGPKRPLPVLAANQHAAGHSGEAYCTASSAPWSSASPHLPR